MTQTQDNQSTVSKADQIHQARLDHHWTERDLGIRIATALLRSRPLSPSRIRGIENGDYPEQLEQLWPTFVKVLKLPSNPGNSSE